jgi:hypothetical protein
MGVGGRGCISKKRTGLIYPYGPSPSPSPSVLLTVKVKAKAKASKRPKQITKQCITIQTARRLY